MMRTTILNPFFLFYSLREAPFSFSALFAILENGVTHGKALVGSHWRDTYRHICVEHKSGWAVISCFQKVDIYQTACIQGWRLPAFVFWREVF